MELIKEKEKTRGKHIGKWLMIASAFFTATGQLFWKWGHSELIFMVYGFACYGIGAVLMIKSLSLEKLSTAYPLMCVSYVIALVYGAVFLGEPITVQKAAAVVLLGIGVTLTSYEK